MSAMWRLLEAPEEVKSKCEWVYMTEKGEWNYYVYQLKAENVIETLP